MDVYSLISKIQKKRPIWDKRTKGHSSRNLVEKCWRTISCEMKIDEGTLRKKWKYLRDQFAVELGKIQALSSEAETVTSNWPYFTSLLFLKDSIKARAMKAGLSDITLNDSQANEREPSSTPQITENGCSSKRRLGNEDDDDDDEDGSIEHSFQTLPIIQIKDCNTSNCPFSSALKKQKLSHNEAINIARFNLEQQKFKYLQSQLDEDDLFFKSLLPHVQKIEPSKKMSFRTRVQQLVDEFAYK